jgi:predicted DsbA family dithiol-disulfide isomerase
MNAIEVQITSDFICPWCWIGLHHLRIAGELAELPVPLDVRFVPFELNPRMAIEGVSRREYRTQKFGSWARAKARDLDVVLAGKAVGAEFNFQRVLITPNTRMAHRMMHYAQQKGEVARVAVLYEAVCAAYFRDGRDIGVIDELIALAVTGGFDGDAVRTYLSSGRGEAEVIQAEEAAQAAGVHAVPNFLIEGKRISGVRTPEIIAGALRVIVDAQLALEEEEEREKEAAENAAG